MVSSGTYAVTGIAGLKEPEVFGAPRRDHVWEYQPQYEKRSRQLRVVGACISIVDRKAIFKAINTINRLFSLTQCLHSSTSNDCKLWTALSYVHMVMALAGAALNSPTVNPLYRDRTPSLAAIEVMVRMTPVS
jgi:hypothetical protein